MAASEEPRVANAPDSAALSARIARGDEAAFAAFYEHWCAPTLMLARAASRRDESYCLDVVHDVMLVVAKKLPALATEAAVGAWLGRTVLRAVSDRRRAEQRRQHRERAVADLAPDDDHEPWHGMVASEQRHWLGERLRELPETDRALVLARFCDAGAVASAAQDLGLGVDAAYGRLRRALLKLRRSAAEWLHGTTK